MAATVPCPDVDTFDEVVEPKTWWLDVGPLVAFVACRGGIQTVMDPIHRSDPAEYRRLYRMWHRAKANGRLLERAADDFCINVLHVTPASVWGHELWRAS